MASNGQGWVTPVDVLDRATLPPRVRRVLTHLVSDVTAATSAPTAPAAPGAAGDGLDHCMIKGFEGRAVIGP